MGIKLELFKTLIFDIAIYYFQSLSIILLSRGITVSTWFESVILSFSSMSISTFGNNNDDDGTSAGYCLIANLDSFDKLLANLLFPLMFIPVFIFFIIINKYTDWTLLNILCFPCYNKKYKYCLTDKCITFFDRKPFMFKCFLRILLLIVGTALSTLFQIITFTKLGNNQIVHYYAPTQPINILSITFSSITICIIFIIFAIICRILYKQTNEERYSSKNDYQDFVTSFNCNKWYWQFIILSKRCIIAIIAALQYLSPDICNLILATYIIIYTGIHIKLNPFHSNIANNLESLCNLSLILILLCLNFNIQTSAFFNVFITICIVIPFMVFLIFGIICIGSWCKSDKNCCKTGIKKGFNKLNRSNDNSVPLITDYSKMDMDQSIATLLDTKIDNIEQSTMDDDDDDEEKEEEENIANSLLNSNQRHNSYSSIKW